MAAATSQIALIGSPRRRATTPRHQAPTMAMAAHRIFPAGLGLTATVDIRIGSWKVPSKGRPGGGGGQQHIAPACISHWSNGPGAGTHSVVAAGAYTGGLSGAACGDGKPMTR